MDHQITFFAEKHCWYLSQRNTCEPPSLPSVKSTDGRVCTSLLILSVNLVRSMLMQISPLAFGAITMGVHQSVGSSVLEIMFIVNTLWQFQLWFYPGMAMVLSLVHAEQLAGRFPLI